ncbi:MAG: PepSY domain-containing protein [Rhodobacteraceae bacterium]|nr:PepSY domain-containing protein [Paracoccaceae bacterium]
MPRIFAAALAATALLAAPSFASDGVQLTDQNIQQVRETLTQQGYDVAKVKTEDGLYEAYARKDGQKFEVFLNGDFEIVRTKKD